MLTPSIGHTGAVLPKRPRILIVEDHTPTRLAMSRLIRQAGAEVVTARDGEEALGYLLTQRFDVLLTDLRMPVMDGWQFLDAWRARRPASRCPVVLLSGLSYIRDAPGVADFLSKPVNKLELTKRVQNMLKLKDVSDEVERLRRYIQDMEDGSGPS